jgi:hypothetical protein
MSRYRSYTDEALSAAVKASCTVAGVLRILRLAVTGGHYRDMHRHFSRLGLDTSHFTGQGHLRGKHHDWKPKRPLSEILVVHSTYLHTSGLKRRLIREGVLVNRCSVCGRLPEWQGKPLTMVLDHRNGDNTDNRLENLRLLCPNCNSQQPTFAGKNRGRYRLV